MLQFYLTAFAIGCLFAVCVGYAHRRFLSRRGWPIINIPGLFALLYALVLYGTVAVGLALTVLVCRFYDASLDERTYFVVTWGLTETAGIIVFAAIYDKRQWVWLSRWNPIKCPVCEGPVNVETEPYLWAYVNDRSCTFSNRAPMERPPGRKVYQVHAQHADELKRRVAEEGFSPEPSLVHGPA